MTIAAITNGFHPSGEVVLEFKDVELGFDQHLVLRGISFRLHRGETKVLFGVAGSGKSVILKLAMGLLKPDAGTITVLGNEVSSMPEHELFDLRRQIGMVFQESALFDSLKVEENVAFRLMEEHIPADEIRKRVTEALRFVELEQTLQKFPSELSGGMRRRVAIARAIVTQPEIILYDSSTGGLVVRLWRRWPVTLRRSPARLVGLDLPDSVRKKSPQRVRDRRRHNVRRLPRGSTCLADASSSKDWNQPTPLYGKNSC